MGIRFYIPLPGPFAYVPGRKRPKQRSDATMSDVTGGILRRLAADTAQRIYGDAHAFAVTKNAEDPKQFALDAVATAKANYACAFAIGLAVTLAFWFWQMGFGTIVLLVVPVVNLVAIGLPAFLIGLLISAYTNSPRNLYADTNTSPSDHDIDLARGKHRANA